MIQEALSRRVALWHPGATGVADAKRLSGGASQETWSFDVQHPDGAYGAILRRAPVGASAAPGRAAGLDAEAALMRLAHAAGVPSPRVLRVLDAADDLGTGFVMDRVAGETIPRKIVRDAEFAGARPLLARQIGAILARIHALPQGSLPNLRSMTADAEIDELQRDARAFGHPRPVMELALRWLRDNDPGPAKVTTLVHGDFRHGNLMIGADGIRAVLDWELAHLGDPMEDLGWVCVNSWRFGEIDKPVGGLGTREEMFAGYEEAGGRVDAARVAFWETMGTLRWGVMCCGMMQRFRDGPEHSMERALIGRRASETEIDLLRLLMPRHTEGRVMQDDPTPAELVKAVADFLRDDIAPTLSGHAGFKLRVGINALDLVVRQLQLGGASDAAEQARLSQIMGLQGTLADLNRDFAAGIASGTIDPNGPGVKHHLWQTTMEKLAVDQPNYAAYRRELAAGPSPD